MHLKQENKYTLNIGERENRFQMQKVRRPTYIQL